VVEPFEKRVRGHVATGRITLRFRHRVDGLVVDDGTVTGVHGRTLASDPAERGRPTNRDELDDFEVRGQAVIVTSGGIGGDHDLVRKAWPARLGTPPKTMVAGVPAHVDGRMLGITEAAGARVINPDRMWHYVEGLRNWDPIWENHGIRILPGPSSLWLDAGGSRLPAPYFPGFDTLGTLQHLRETGWDYSWFVLTQKIIEKEFALSGSEQNPDLTGKDLKLLLGRVVSKGAPGPVEAFKEHGQDFVVADSLDELVAGMNAIADPDVPPLTAAELRPVIEARDREIDNAFSKDAQVTAIHGARKYRGDRLIRVASPHKILDPKAGPLIAVRLNILSRKTLGGLETDLSGRCLRADGTPFPGLYAAGEVNGFGGGGMMGYNALEGTFLGGCLFSGRAAGRAAAAAVG
jgi:predicted oxidoreductase